MPLSIAICEAEYLHLQWPRKYVAFLHVTLALTELTNHKRFYSPTNPERMDHGNNSPSITEAPINGGTQLPA